MKRQNSAKAWYLFSAVLLLGGSGTLTADPEGDATDRSNGDTSFPQPTNAQIQRAFEAGEAFRGSAAAVERKGAWGEAIPEHYIAASPAPSASDDTGYRLHPYDLAWRRGRWWCSDFVRIPRIPLQVGVTFPAPIPVPLSGRVAPYGFPSCFDTLHH